MTLAELTEFVRGIAREEIKDNRAMRREVLTRHHEGMTDVQIAAETGYKLVKVRKVIKNNT